MKGNHIPLVAATLEINETELGRILDHLEELLPGTKRVEIPDASHIMREDSPTAYNMAVLSFLSAH